jgi:molybdopterin synthase sulfur carrier subunit
MFYSIDGKDMIAVNVKLFLTLREAVGKTAVELSLPEHATIMDVINLMAREYGRGFSRYIFDEENKVREFFNFSVNGQNIKYLNGLETKLKNGDSIVILPPTAGG